MTIRDVTSADYDLIAARLDEWWGGRNMLEKLPRLFFDHFSNTSFVFEIDKQIIGFLIGFHSPVHQDEAYIHFIGVHPDHRGRHVAQQLYQQFYEKARKTGRNVVKCITSPVNRGSIAFHTTMGFEVLPGDIKVDGVSVFTDYDGPGQDRVVFRKGIG